eukprot:7925802-Karenia_brevis.AAC.1
MSDVGERVTLQICTDPKSDPVLQIIDQCRRHARMSPINMRHVFETQVDLSDEAAMQVRNARGSDVVSM